MIAVIFEAIPHPEHSKDYFDIAAALKDHLEEVDGFLSVERFESLTHPGKFLSLSFWRDEEAVQQWRNLQVHRSAQRTGRNRVFADYRLRVAAVVRDYGLEDRKEAPDDSLSAHRPE
ncbi:antibiotic biosynthesis monooxygenase [Natronospirillum operosum]|uniref:Antibiotic biosynthesis monooxygenase n=1 Tax=Natronospirillum operosum TaxID=2759953 RepID=A0A4Z0WES8_9GAMM|nr:antibiotic biosynthesis monooxygenase [Natronospirillum operosum]TGG92826.1 antibiotic biosynthesis monooxygenase [Natronospirillum operosum]